MLDYSETSENVYLAFNQNIGLKNKRFQNLVHLTFNKELFLTINFCSLLQLHFHFDVKVYKVKNCIHL